MTEKEMELKKLLFGNQKQANVINDSVVMIASEYFYAHTTDTQDMSGAMYKLLQEITGADYATEAAELFVKLVCGVNSFNTWKAGVPFIITADQPSTESPKYNFRITPLGEEVVPETEPEDKLQITGKPLVAPDEVYDERDDFPTRARKIKEAILPLVPASVKAELPDNEYAQALCCAEYYYNQR